jgi:DNA recombination protein RmuC
LTKVKTQTLTMLNSLENAEVRSRAMGRALRSVEALPEDASKALLPPDGSSGDPT